jgi:hypothetical protein
VKHDLIPSILSLYQRLFVDHEMKLLRKVHGRIPLCDANLLTISTTSRARGKSGGLYIYESGKIAATKKNGMYSIDVDDGGKKRKNAPLSKISLRQMNKRCLTTIFHGEGEHIVEEVYLCINVLEKLLVQVMYYRSEGF